MQTPDSHPSLDALQKRIDSARKAHQDPAGQHPPTSTSYGMRVGLDLVSGVCVGTAAGYGLDRWLGTLPWLMIICMALGTAAGVKLMMQTSRRAAQALEEEESNTHG